jgi:uncharacterized phage protein gp47/JayE
LILTNPATGRSYRNTAGFTLNALTSITVPIAAVEVGSASNAGAGTITELATLLLGVTSSNAIAVVGLDEESDAALRSRCSEKLGALSPFGPWDAYASAARNARRADGSTLGITRFRILKDGYGNVTTYLATASGPVPSPDLDIADEAIQQYAAPVAVTAIVLSATSHPIAVTYETWMYNTSGKTVAQVQALIATRLGTFFSGQPIGGHVIDGDPGLVFVEAIRAVIHATLPEIFHVEVTAPAGDVTLTVDEVPTYAAPVCTGIHQEAPPEGFEG